MQTNVAADVEDLYLERLDATGRRVEFRGTWESLRLVRETIDVRGGDADEASFVKLRTGRDAGLAAPRLILPALQVNIRAGELPPPDANGIRYLRLPINQLGGAQ